MGRNPYVFQVNSKTRQENARQKYRAKENDSRNPYVFQVNSK